MGKRIRHIQEPLPGLEPEEPAPLAYDDRFKLTPEEIETGLRGIAAARQVLAEQQARKTPPPKPEGGPRVELGSRALKASRLSEFINGHTFSRESGNHGSK